MAPPLLHVVGIDPGATTGWARFTVPRACIYGTEPSAIESWDTGEISGDENWQVTKLSRMAREIQGLDYLVGPVFVVEDFDVSETVTTDTEVLYSPVRIAAKLSYAEHRSELNDGRVLLQPRTLAKTTITDDRLRRAGYWVEGSAHERDAVRHALTFLRRVRGNAELRDRAWADPNGRTVIVNRR